MAGFQVAETVQVGSDNEDEEEEVEAKTIPSSKFMDLGYDF